MPEVIKTYSIKPDLLALSSVFDSLITAYMDDVEKYAHTNLQTLHIGHAIRTSFAQAGRRIKFEGFGNSSYRSRDMSEALRTVEKALLISLVYPTSGAKLPLMAGYRKSPRLHVLDTGMLNYFAGIQKEILSTDDLNKVYQGTMIEHLVGQELLATQFTALSALYFWVREKNTSSAEVDYVFPFDGQLIPIAVKSGAEGKLKSLHLFMDQAPHNMAVRFYAGALSVSDVQTQSGKRYKLLNLPYYLVSQLEKYLVWFKNQV